MNGRINNNGITLMSMIITIVLMLILLFTVMYAFGGLTDKARLAALIYEMDSIETAVGIENAANIKKEGPKTPLLLEDKGPQTYTEKTLNRFGYRPEYGEELYELAPEVKNLVGKDVNLKNYLMSKNLRVYYTGNSYGLLLNDKVKEEDEQPSGADPDTEEGELDDEAIVKLRDNLALIITSCLTTLKDTASNAPGGGVRVVMGDVYSDHSGVYVFRHDDWITANELNSMTGLADLNRGGLIRLRTRESVLQIDNFNSIANKWEEEPEVGRLYYYAGNLYACAWSSGEWTTSNPANGGVWIEINKDYITNY